MLFAKFMTVWQVNHNDNPIIGYIRHYRIHHNMRTRSLPATKEASEASGKPQKANDSIERPFA